LQGSRRLFARPLPSRVFGLAAGVVSYALPQRTKVQQEPAQLVGIFSLERVSPNSSVMLAFRRGLAENGFFEGKISCLSFVRQVNFAR
jgi:hypothetical protein